MFSVLILTLNEQEALPGCLASVKGCDDVWVLDSGSTDATLEIARAAGARVASHPFQSFAQQRNHAREAIAFRHPWVFHLDADERFTPELFEECARWPDDAPFDGTYAAPRMLFHGAWVPRSTDYPALQARFARAAAFRWIEYGHGQREAPGMRMAYLRSNYLHEMMSGGEARWLEKHRRYARVEAAQHAGQSIPLRTALRQCLSDDRLERRRALKALSYRLPARPALRFLYQYALRRGFLDGRAGWRYCRLLARYEGFIAEAQRSREK